MQDTYTKNRLTLNLGFRFDLQDDAALAADVPANPFFPTLMPAIDFQGADAGVVWKDFSPRLGITYDLKGDGRNVVSASYCDLLRPDGARPALEPAGRHRRGVRPLPVDRRQRRRVRAGRRSQHHACRSCSKSTAYDPANPTSTASPTRVDPNVKNDRTREFIVGFDRQLGSQMAVGGSYIWRKYDQFLWNDRDNWTSANYRAVTLPADRPARAGARCEPVDLLRAEHRRCRRRTSTRTSPIGGATSTASS